MFIFLLSGHRLQGGKKKENWGICISEEISTGETGKRASPVPEKHGTTGRFPLMSGKTTKDQTERSFSIQPAQFSADPTIALIDLLLQIHAYLVP